MDIKRRFENSGWTWIWYAFLRNELADVFSWPAENETEISMFNRELYEAFKLNPEVLCPATNPSYFVDIWADTVVIELFGDVY